MSKQVKLSVRPRTESGRNAVKQVRARGGVPAVIYGSKQSPENLEINEREIQSILAHAAGENILVELEINDGKSTTNRLSLIQDVQHDTLRDTILHVDFLAVSTTEEIEAEVVIEPVGEADGVKNFGGILEQSLRTLAVRCLPQNLPDVLHVDVSALKVGESFHVRDLVLPEGVKPAVDGDLTVIAVAEPNVAVESSGSSEQTSPEVLKEKKAEGEDKK